MRAAILALTCAAGIALFVIGTPASAGPLQENGFTLTVSVSGQGHVSSSPGGIDCPGRCSATFPVESTVTLSKSASSGWDFAGWGGDCSGTGGCKVTMTKNREVNATFQQPSEPPPTPPPPPPKPKFTLTVAVTGPGMRTAIENGTPRSQIAKRILTSGEARTRIVKSFFSAS